MQPKKIQIKDAKLFINWDDGESSEITLRNLRRNCPCAYCNKEREEESKSYIPIYFDQQMEVEDIKLVGSYAVGIKWKDGHNTGIYEYNHLKKLANNNSSK